MVHSRTRRIAFWYKYTEGCYGHAIVLYHLLVIAPRLKVDRQTGGYCNCRGAHNRANSGGSAKQQSARGFIIYARLPPGPTYKTRVCRPPFAWTCNFALPSASFAHSCIHPLMIICPRCWNKINTFYCSNAPLISLHSRLCTTNFSNILNLPRICDMDLFLQL